MGIKKKEMYISPEAKTFEVKSEGVICGSLTLTDPDDYIPAEDPFLF